MTVSQPSKKRQRVKALRELVRSELTEFLKAKGFEREKGDSLTYAFRRRRPDQHDLFEVQFSKYQNPKFKVNLGTVPVVGLVDAWGRLLPPEDVRIGRLAWRGTLCASPFGEVFFGWFGIGCLSILPLETAAAGQIRKVEHLFNQADQWFGTGARGPNISTYYLDALGPNASRRDMERTGRWPPANWSEKDEEAVRRAETLLRSIGSSPAKSNKEQDNR